VHALHIALARSLRVLEETHSAENCNSLLIYLIGRFSVACQIHANFTVFLRVGNVRNVHMKGRMDAYTTYTYWYSKYTRIMVNVIIQTVCIMFRYMYTCTVVLYLHAQCAFSVNIQD
jgi:hypothetical protein